MPELPSIELYLACLEPRIVGQVLERVEVSSLSLLRTVEPPISAVEGKRVSGVRRLGKRVVIALEGDLFLCIHLMIAGRFQWKKQGAKAGGRRVHAVFHFSSGSLVLTEAGTKKRASLHVLRGEPALAALDPGGAEVFEIDLDAFREIVTRENHTLKRTLTDPHLLSGIGNAYSDEILHRARLSPVKLSQRLGDDEVERLYHATRDALRDWTRRLKEEVGDGFPEKVTAFHPEMAVHGRHREPCPDCGAPVQRIVRGDHETNYCPTCQTGGKVLADRALSQLLKKDWPRSLEELEQRAMGLEKGAEATARTRRSE